MKRKKPLKRGASKQSERTRLRVWGPPSLRPYVESLPCALCDGTPVDAHHIKSRSQGGEWMDNLIPLCRVHHNRWHTDKLFRDEVRDDLKHAASLLSLVYISFRDKLEAKA